MSGPSLICAALRRVVWLPAACAIAAAQPPPPRLSTARATASPASRSQPTPKSVSPPELPHAQQAPDYNSQPAAIIDLRSCSWQTSPGASTARFADRLEIHVRSLPHPAARTVACWIKLASAEPQIVEGINHGAVTEDGWTFSIERPGFPPVTLYDGSQEGRFRFPLGAMTKARIGIAIGIPGDNPGYLRLPELRIAPAPRALPAAPRPVSPAPGEALTPAATDFFWQASQPAATVAYQVEWRRANAAIHKLRADASFQTDAMRVSPPRFLSPGQYSWRVRAINLLQQPGPWSPWISFRVAHPPAAQEPDLSPNSSDPLFLIDLESADPASAWKRLPADIQPHVLFRIGGAIATVQSTLEAARAGHVPIALQVNGPHDVIAGRWDRLPLARLLDWANENRNLRAFYICEQAVQGGIRNPEVRDYLTRLIALGAETGRPVIWADANWGRNEWQDVLADSDFTRFLHRHRGFLFPVWKMNGGFVPYLAPSGLLGLWISGTVTEWGVQPESWYWVEAGFRSPGVQGDYKEGIRTDAPPVIFQQLALVGASVGAAIYSFEPGVDLLSGGLGDPNALENIFVPLARLLLVGTVPTETQVTKAVQRWHTLQPGDLTFRKGYNSALRLLFSRTLGIAYPFQEVPASGNCYWIPFFTPASPAPASLLHNSPHDCHAPVPRQAAVFRAGRSAFALNSRVNWQEPQRFHVRLGPLAIHGILGLNGWLVAQWLNHDRVRLWFSARRDASVRLDFVPAVYWRFIADSRWSAQPIAHLQFPAGRSPTSILVSVGQPAAEHR